MPVSFCARQGHAVEDSAESCRPHDVLSLNDCGPNGLRGAIFRSPLSLQTCPWGALLGCVYVCQAAGCTLSVPDEAQGVFGLLER